MNKIKIALKNKILIENITKTLTCEIKTIKKETQINFREKTQKLIPFVLFFTFYKFLKIKKKIVEIPITVNTLQTNSNRPLLEQDTE